MFNEKPVREAMALVGFEYIERFTYRYLSPSREIRYFVTFALGRMPSYCIRAMCMVGNLDADLFAVKCYFDNTGRDYGLDLTKTALNAVSGVFTKRSPSFDCIELNGIPPDALKAQIADSFEQYLVPVMKQVGTRKELFDLLMSDVKPFSWGVTNGAMRVAQIAHLALHLGMSAEVIREIPAPLLEGFQLKGLAVTEYLERVISAANIQYAKEIASKGSD